MSRPVALVTGAGRGIGAATALLLARDFDLMLTSRTLRELEATQSKIQATSQASVCIFAGDISNQAQVQALFAKLQDEFSRLDVLINNAGFIKPKPLMETSWEEWKTCMAVNLDALFFTCQSAIPLLQKQDQACIINVSSLAGLQGLPKFPGFVAYSAAKAGVIGFSESLAAELRDTSIRVHAFAPGAVNTKMLAEALPEFKTSTQPEDAARKLLELLEEQSTGQVLALANHSG